MSRTIQGALRTVAADLVDGWTLESITCTRAADEIDYLKAKNERLEAFIADRIHDATVERMMLEVQR